MAFSNHPRNTRLGRTAIITALVSMAALAGCLQNPFTDEGDDNGNATAGDGDHGDFTTGNTTTGTSTTGNTTGNTTTNTTTSANGTGDPPGNSAGNQTGNTTGNATWSYDNRTGSVSGTYLMVFAPAEEEEAVTVENGTLHMFLNLTVEGDDVEFSVRPPGCADDDCAEEVTVTDGSASFEALVPAEGAWTAVISADPGIGPYSSDYALEVATLAPA